MNKTLIELKAINALERELNRTNRIVPEVKDNDKTPSWDGEIRFYKKDSEDFCKDDLINKVPIQVKGTYRTNFNNGSLSYSVDVADLRNYQKDNGVMFFFIQIKSDDEYRTFYKSLLPFELRRIIDGLKKGQKTKTIKLARFPQKHIDGISTIINDFIINRKKQGKLLAELTSLSDAKNIDVEKFEFTIPDENVTSADAAIDYLLSNPIYVYAKPKGISESFAVDIISTSKISQKIDAPILVNKEVLFEGYEIIKSRNQNPVIRIGKNIIINVEKTQIKATVNEKGILSELIKSYKFYLAVANNEDVFIDKKKFGISNVQIDKREIAQAKRNLETLISIKQALDKLNVKKDLDVSNVDNSEVVKLAHIAKSINEGCPVPIYSEYDSVASLFTIGNVSILLKVVNSDKKHYSCISDYYKNRDIGYRLENSHEECFVSPYVVLDKEAIINSDNFNTSDIVESIKSFDICEIYAEKINEFALILLNLFDEGYFKADEILSIVLELYEYLEAYDKDSDIYHINRIQTSMRLGNLNECDKEYLIKLKSLDKSTDFKVAANILLGSYIEASYEYKKLSKKEKERFDKFPISNLWQH